MGSLLAILGMSFYTNIEQPTPEVDPVKQAIQVRFQQQSKTEEPDQYAWLNSEPQTPKE
jgi:hypothetical protein